ncbi:hypothetical protein HPJ99_06925 [Anoxybacillus flavithermus]|uniref:hypothetical protein n=1 Tax=Anoxybacillus flavithermus TaxID=33934 RepID=UPI00186937D1|nr:hypothetical protein [Anoxybacillus flavithermus]MBE2905394.1 hypothetical protein [Anoxybacillus flavithermus]MBE2923917.1 hypothetical protein [Anoxybacillus flavithermus]MBE2934966.1 hypothetical protein [Anoxybacillus flavithermus]MBE2945879.1 hypothetical protein [Anoxybacillus flavithermus]MBE2948743.1 hypothetical protein [Anoxybacillus flavithermus]
MASKYKTVFTVFLDSSNKLLRLYLLKTPDPENKLIFIIPEVNWSAMINEDEIENVEDILMNSLKENKYTSHDTTKIISTIKQLYKLS